MKCMHGCRWVAEEDHIVNFPTVRLKGGMPIRVTSKDKILHAG